MRSFAYWLVLYVVALTWCGGGTYLIDHFIVRRWISRKTLHAAEMRAYTPWWLVGFSLMFWTYMMADVWAPSGICRLVAHVIGAAVSAAILYVGKVKVSVDTARCRTEFRRRHSRACIGG